MASKDEVGFHPIRGYSTSKILPVSITSDRVLTKSSEKNIFKISRPYSMNLAIKAVDIHFPVVVVFPSICTLFDRDKCTTYAIRHGLFLCGISERR